MPSPTATRSKQLKLTMTPEMHSRLVALADKLGQTPATLASVALSLYVTQMESTLGATQRAVEGMASSMGPHVAEAFKQMTLQDATPALEDRGPTLVGVGQ